ncbi:MAG: MarR family winged helix-turn-helix transcriptional regulator [Acidobacteriota bacterium]
MKKKTEKTTAETIAQGCIAGRMRLLNRVVTRTYDDALRPLGIKTSQLNILVVTAGLGLARPAEISSRLKMEISTVSRNVDRMRAQGWVEVVEDEQDARAHKLRLSGKGKRLLEKAKPAWDKAQAIVKELLGRDGVQAIMSGAESAGATV